MYTCLAISRRPKLSEYMKNIKLHLGQSRNEREWWEFVFRLFPTTLPTLHISPLSTPIINQNAKGEREREFKRRMAVVRGGKHEEGIC
jgi:hypothetical protein